MLLFALAPPALAGMVMIILYAIILAVLLYVVKIILDLIALPPPVKTLVWLLVGVLVLIVIVQFLGV